MVPVAAGIRLKSSCFHGEIEKLVSYLTALAELCIGLIDVEVIRLLLLVQSVSDL